MDYDTSSIPLSYDRARGHRPEVLQQWVTTVSEVLGRRVATILDLGCGTGRFSRVLATHFGAEVIGIDPSEQMLERARRKQAAGSRESIRFLLASPDAIPLPRSSVDLIFMSQVFHHLRDPQQVARCCRDVLIDSGAVFVRNSTVDNISSIRYVDFFPQTRALLHERLPRRETVQIPFEAAGFRVSSRGEVEQQLASNASEYAEKLSFRADSIVASLSVPDFEQGMAELRKYASETEGSSPIFETVDFFLFQK